MCMTGVTEATVYWRGMLCGTFYTIPFGFSVAFTCAKANFLTIVSVFCLTKAWNSRCSSQCMFV